MKNALRILLFGETGQVARAFIKRAEGDATVAITAVSHQQADFMNAASVAAALKKGGPTDIVVNAVAYTAVDKAERDYASAFQVNAESVGVMAETCAQMRVPLIHLSTDYVFDGAKPAPYVESDLVGPLNVYGETKQKGEDYIRQTLSQHVIVRTSWVYSATGSNFVKTMLRLGAERDSLNVVDDQRGGPTAAHQIAEMLLVVARRATQTPPVQAYGLFHFTGGGETSWYDFARAIFGRVEGWAGTKAAIRPIPTAAYPTPARRPLNSRLDCQKIASIYGVRQDHWETALERVLLEIKTSQTGTLS